MLLVLSFTDIALCHFRNPHKYGMLNFSMAVSGSAAVTYLLDTHRAYALHKVLALSNLGKNMPSSMRRHSSRRHGLQPWRQGLGAHTRRVLGLLLARKSADVRGGEAGGRICECACSNCVAALVIRNARAHNLIKQIARHPQLFERYLGSINQQANQREYGSTASNCYTNPSS